MELIEGSRGSQRAQRARGARGSQGTQRNAECFCVSLSFVFFFLLIFVPLSVQAESGNPRPLQFNAEVSRLGRISVNAEPLERYNAFIALARLHQLAGNSEAALEAIEGASALFPADNQLLLMKARFLISLGEYERASRTLNTVLIRAQEPSLLLQGRYLAALTEAFRSNTGPLMALASDPVFIEYRSAIYYTLWRLTADQSFRTRLSTEFPHSPEGRIIADNALPAFTPLWMLFPGRDSITLSPPPGAVPTAVSPVTAAPPIVPVTPVPVQAAPAAGVMLQTGLFRQQANAQTQAEQLRRAGFQPEVFPRQVNNNNYWAVGVRDGENRAAMTQRLRNAGFDSFPLPHILPQTP